MTATKSYKVIITPLGEGVITPLGEGVITPLGEGVITPLGEGVITPLGKGGLKGIIHAPASKSSMQRACAAALLTKGKTIIHNPGHSNDDKAAIDIIQKLGAIVTVDGAQMTVDSKGVKPVTTEINCGESGLSIRMFTPLVALSDKEITINGQGSLATRPMDFFDEILPKLQVKIKSNKGRLPLKIQGPLQPANIEVDGSLSSQFLTGLLMAYSASPNPSFEGAGRDSVSRSVSIKVKNLKSKPYIDLTLDVMKKFGLQVPENRNYEEFIFYNHSSNSKEILPLSESSKIPSLEEELINAQGQLLENSDSKEILPVSESSKIPPSEEELINAQGQLLENSDSKEILPLSESSKIPPSGGGGAYTVEGDWSGSAFLLVAGAIAGPITVRGLDLSSTQADKAIVDALMKANAGIAMDGKAIQLVPSAMTGFEFDATDCPDLFPPLVALAAYCKGNTNIKGVSRLTHKESNRALTLQQEFGKMGVHIQFNDDTMIIQGGKGVKGAKVHSRHDHRIAMACTIAALKAQGETVIEEAGAVKKSYPDFYRDLRQLGAALDYPALIV